MNRYFYNQHRKPLIIKQTDYHVMTQLKSIDDLNQDSEEENGSEEDKKVIEEMLNLSEVLMLVHISII